MLTGSGCNTVFQEKCNFIFVFKVDKEIKKNSIIRLVFPLRNRSFDKLNNNHNADFIENAKYRDFKL